MRRYPRAVRDAQLKCISCNAPLVTTVDDRFVCVECGGEPIRRNGHRMSTDGGTIERSPVGADGGVVARTEELTEAIPESFPETSGLLLPPDSEQRPEISFVFPTKNEEGGVGECIDRAVEAVETLGMTAEIIVSDSSEDRTPDIARWKGAFVVEPDGLGYGNAYRYAFERARGDLIVMGDADTTYDFAELPKLMGPILDGDADMVLGSRFAGTIEPGAMPALHQYVGNPLLTKFLNVFYGAGVSDAHSGFRVFTRDAYERLDLRSNGMEFASEMIMDAGSKGLRIEEVPITYHERVGEAELDSLSDGWRHVKFMLTNAPTYLFAVPGVVLGALGLLAMLLSTLGPSIGPVTFGAHTMIAGSLLTIVGYQIGLLAVFSAFSTEPIRKPRDPITRLLEDNFRLEHGATVGVAMAGLGGLYATFLVARWVASGFSSLPLVSADMLAFTAVVVGLETLFASFHLSALQDRCVGRRRR